MGLPMVVLATLLVAGSLGARPDTGLASPDLEIVQRWIAGGRIADFSAVSGHLAKPGYLLFLRFALPHGGLSQAENQRLLLFQATVIAVGAILVCFAIWWRGRPIQALLAATLLLLCLPLRDSADYIATEPLAIGFSLLFCVLFVALPGRRPVADVATAMTCAVFALVRPNTSYALMFVAVLLVASNGAGALRRIGTLVLGFLGAIFILIIASSATGLPLNPLSMSSSEALLFATADYGWPSDLGVKPVGKSRAETAQLQTRMAWERWRLLLNKPPADRARSLLWRMTHGLVSAEQFPPQWRWPMYVAADKSVRRWWWLAASLTVLAAGACAGASSGSWRFVPAALLVATVLQGFVFGAETRYVLPLLPVLIVGLARSLPTVRWTPRSAVAAAVPALLLGVVVARVPDTANSDYAVIRGPGHVLRQQIPPSRVPAGETATLHARILKPDPFPLGFEVRENGHLLARRTPEDLSPFPAYFSWTLAGEALRQAQRQGLDLEIRTIGDASTRDFFLYYPVIPPILDGASTLDGDRWLPSPFSGKTRGGMPIWIHPGGDGP